MKKKFKRFATLLLVIWSQTIFGQDTFTCTNQGYTLLNGVIGHWKVQTKDRTAPGVYQKNSGNAIISAGIPGCSISISYRGKYRDKAYAREVNLIALDSIHYQMVAMDSEHGTYSFLEGAMDNDQLILHWFRNKAIGKLRSKYELTVTNANTFEFSSYLSTDFGENWALTHQRIYRREE